MAEEIKEGENNLITKRNEDFSQWYLDIIAAADLADYAPVKGCMVIKPYGYAIWENIQKILDANFKATGHENAYFPLFIPESFLKKEAEHVEGFSPELAVVTHAGGKKLEENLVVRPTSETIIYSSFAKWIHSWRDLPMLINQWCNVVRWEMRTRLFLRTTEFLWQEGHTAHATHEESQEEARRMIDVYKSFVEDYLALPVIVGRKSDSERFAGAVETFTIEALMQDCKALQCGTAHDLGQNFSKAFDISFLDQQGQKQNVWQTSWGVSTRLIGALIMAHSDDKGLVLPPRIAPLAVVIVPIWKDDKEKKSVVVTAEKIKASLENLAVKIDDRDLRPGQRYYDWERKGVPVRLEIGPRDVEAGQVVLVRRDTGEKIKIKEKSLAKDLKKILAEIQDNFFERAREFQKENTRVVDDWDNFQKVINEQGGFVSAQWCGDPTCEKEIKTVTKATIRCLPFGDQEANGPCVHCGRQAKYKAFFAIAY